MATTSYPKISCVLFALVTATVSACSVYAPMQPYMPMLRAQGQAEVQANWLPVSRFDAGAAYSPWRYVVLTAAGSFRPRGDYDTTYFYNRQYEMGMGSYWPATDRLLLSGLVGGGYAFSQRSFKEVNLFFGSTTTLSVYQARYRKLFGQLGLAYEWDHVTLGGTFRLTEVGFTTITYNDQPLPIRRMLRGEPLLFLRINGLGDGPPQGQLQITLGLSQAVKQGPPIEDFNSQRIFNPGVTAGMGVVFYPHRFNSRRRHP